MTEKADQPGYGRPGRWLRAWGGSVPVNYVAPVYGAARRPSAPRLEPRADMRALVRDYTHARPGTKFKDNWRKFLTLPPG